MTMTELYKIDLNINLVFIEICFPTQFIYFFKKIMYNNILNYLKIIIC